MIQFEKPVKSVNALTTKVGKLSFERRKSGVRHKVIRGAIGKFVIRHLKEGKDVQKIASMLQMTPSQIKQMLKMPMQRNKTKDALITIYRMHGGKKNWENAVKATAKQTGFAPHEVLEIIVS